MVRRLVAVYSNGWMAYENVISGFSTLLCILTFLLCSFVPRIYHVFMLIRCYVEVFYISACFYFFLNFWVDVALQSLSIYKFVAWYAWISQVIQGYMNFFLVYEWFFWSRKEWLCTPLLSFVRSYMDCATLI